LNRARAGAVVVIKQLNASPEMNQRLREMGFGEERRVKLISLNANILCQVCNARLGLSERLAACIMVAHEERLAA
jgi:Fe2+ transport system protein FeoA